MDGIGTYTCQCEDSFVLNAVNKFTCHPDTMCITEEEINACDNGNPRSTCAKVCVLLVAKSIIF